MSSENVTKLDIALLTYQRKKFVYSCFTSRSLFVQSQDAIRTIASPNFTPPLAAVFNSTETSSVSIYSTQNPTNLYFVF